MISLLARMLLSRSSNLFYVIHWLSLCQTKVKRHIQKYVLGRFVSEMDGGCVLIVSWITVELGVVFGVSSTATAKEKSYACYLLLVDLTKHKFKAVPEFHYYYCSFLKRSGLGFTLFFVHLSLSVSA